MIVEQNSDLFLFQEYTGNSEIFYSGRYGALVYPKCVYHNGYTYLTCVLDDINRDPILLRYGNGETRTVQVGQIDNFDPLYHQHPSIQIINDFIYIFMVNGHGTDIKIWKSNTTDMTDGFRLHHTIIGFYGYCSTRLLKDGRVIILSRVTALNFAQVFMISAVNDYTSWTVRETTETEYATTDVRHYPSMPKHYGNNEWQYFGISLRNDTPATEVYFGQAIYKTKDYETFYSLDQSFKKNIVVDGELTPVEVENNLMILGSNTNSTTYVGTMNAIIINDVVYGSGFDSGVWKFYKIENGTTTFFDCNLPNLPSEANFSYNLDHYYNGKNLIIFSKGVAYTSDFNYSQITPRFKYYNLGNPTGINIVAPPINYQDINENYLLVGSDKEVGVVPYYLTNERFEI